MMAHPSLQVLAWLLDWLLKGFLALGCAFTADAIFRRASAHLRHLLWLCGLSLVILLPFLSLAVPRLNLPVLSLSMLAGQPGTGGEHSAAGSGVALDAPRLLIAMYLAGVLGVLVWQSVGRAYVVRLRRRSAVIRNAEVNGQLRRLCDALDVRGEVALMTNPAALVPFSTGVVHPAIVLPPEWSDWHSSALESVLIHELGHIRRNDSLTRIISQVGCCIHWINPFAWIGLRRVMTEQEIACDNLVLESGTKPSAYARDLLLLAKVRGERLYFAMTPLGHRSELHNRLLEILRPRRSRAPLRALSSTVFAAGTCILLLPIAALNLWRSPDTGVAPQASGIELNHALQATHPPASGAYTAAPTNRSLPDPRLFKETISKQIQKMRAEGAPEQKIVDFALKAKAKLADLEKRKQAEATSKESPKSSRPE